MYENPYNISLFINMIYYSVENNIIRKTKRSEKIKRSVLPCKTKCSFFRFPLHNVKRLRFLWGISCFLSSFSNIQVKLHTLITFKQLPCSL